MGTEIEMAIMAFDGEEHAISRVGKRMHVVRRNSRMDYSVGPLGGGMLNTKSELYTGPKQQQLSK